MKCSLVKRLVFFNLFIFKIFSYYFWKILTKTFHKNLQNYSNFIFVNKNKNTKLILILILHDTMINKGILKRMNLIKQNFKFKNKSNNENITISIFYLLR